jgi:hypothetical protein
MRTLFVRGVKVTVKQKDYDFAVMFSKSSMPCFRKAMAELGIRFSVAGSQPATEIKDFDDLQMYFRINGGLRKEIR